MYYRYFGLTEAPFSIAVNPRYLFMSARHRDALAHLLYGVGEGGGFVLLTGEVGTGKTTIIRSLLEQLPPETDIAMVFNPALNAEELLATVCDELGASYMQDSQSLKTLTDSLHQFLLRNHAQGRNTVLLIDEAQHLQFDVLEQIRLLTNLETNSRKLLQIILVGQPELRALLNQPELRQLAQRITARYQLKPLDLPETEEYIRHRLQVAGLGNGRILFPRDIVKKIHRLSRGVPRIINVLCDRMLLGAYGQNKSCVDSSILKQAVVEVLDMEGANTVSKPAVAVPALAVGLVIGAIAAGALLWSPLLSQPPEPAIQTAAMTESASVQPESNEATAPEFETLTSGPAPAAGIERTIAPATSVEPRLDALWLRTEPPAIQLLLAAIEPGADPESTCSDAAGQALRCQRINVQSWQELADYNRPAVLTLLTPSRLLRYVVVMGFDDERVFVLDKGETHSLPLAELGQLWNGEALFFWRTHPDYNGPFSSSHRGPVVAWLAQQFAQLDRQEGSLSQGDFNAALLQRVKLFQQANGLEADGVVGLKTLLKLDEQLTSPITFISSLPAKYDPGGEGIAQEG